ncbi:hypothetical protein V2J09_009063 [Rumex salicifolius]
MAPPPQQPEAPRVTPQVSMGAQHMGNAPASFSPEMLATVQQIINQTLQAVIPLVHPVVPNTPAPPNPPAPVAEIPPSTSERDPSKIAMAFEKLRPPAYEGIGDPVEVEHWINQMEKILRVDIWGRRKEPEKGESSRIKDEGAEKLELKVVYPDLDDGKDLSAGYMRPLYERITKNEIKMKGDELAPEHKQSVCWARMLAAYNVPRDQSDDELIVSLCLDGFQRLNSRSQWNLRPRYALPDIHFSKKSAKMIAPLLGKKIESEGHLLFQMKV